MTDPTDGADPDEAAGAPPAKELDDNHSDGRERGGGANEHELDGGAGEQGGELELDGGAGEQGDEQELDGRAGEQGDEPELDGRAGRGDELELDGRAGEQDDELELDGRAGEQSDELELDGRAGEQGSARRPRNAGESVPSVTVRFRVPGQSCRFECGDLALRRGQRVLVDSDQGQAVATVTGEPRPASPDRPRRQVLRIINDDDLRVLDRNRVREREAFHFCVERIKARGIPMKLVDVELAHSGTRAVFYFSSADRVDFRSLVKDLARRFHTRIEMRQIGVRDAARHTGGLGTCGRELCCATWLPAFQPISIRMAKDQNLALNHQKLSGLCGRLRCCLQYEQEIYQDQRKGLPKVGKRVITPQGEARVKDVDVLRRQIRVQLVEGGYALFGADEVTRPTDQQQHAQQQRRQPQAQPQAQPQQQPQPQSQPRQQRPLEKGAEEAQPETSGTAEAAAGEPAPRSGRRRRRRRGRRGKSKQVDGSPGGGSPGEPRSSGDGEPPAD